MAPQPFNDSDIDEVLLSFAGKQWRKVAMLVAQTVEAMGSEGSDKHDLVAARVKALIDCNVLDAQGDISRWRHSEVRLAPSA